MDGPELPATQILRPLQQDAMPFKKIDLLNISPANSVKKRRSVAGAALSRQELFQLTSC